MKKFDYTTKGIQKARAGMMMETGPDAIMKYGGGCGRTMPKYSNNPRTIQGRQLRKGGSV